MAQVKIVIADPDANYLSHILKPFAYAMGEFASIDIISDLQFFEQFFSTPQDVDLILINKSMYNENLLPHAKGHVFLLSEESVPVPAGANKGSVTELYKYMPIQELFSTVIHFAGLQTSNSKSEETNIITLYSPSGGLGQTTLSVGLCAHFAKNFQKVLYIGMDNIQSTGVMIQSKQQLQQGSEKALLSKSDYAYDVLKPQIISSYFDILPPFLSSLPSLGIKPEHFVHLIDQIAASRDYEYIVLDTAREFDESITRFMSMASKVLLVTSQDDISAHKFARLIENIDCSDNKFVFVCNKYKAKKANCLQQLNFEFVGDISNVDLYDVDALGKNPDIQKLGQFLL